MVLMYLKNLKSVSLAVLIALVRLWHRICLLYTSYNLISEYAHQSGEIVYLTKYGKGDLVVMSIKTFEQREEKFKFYHTVMQADLDRQKSAEELFDGDDAIARLKAKFID